MNDIPSSWQPQFQVGSKWFGNGYRYASRERSLEFAETVAARRRVYRVGRIGDVRAVLTNDPVNREEDQ